MEAKNTNFRVILALTTLPQDLNLSSSTLKVTLANTTKTITLLNKEAVPLDYSGVQAGAKLEFGLEDAQGFMFGYSELKVPNAAFEKNETEINEQLRFYLINKEKDFFTANVYVIFLNKGLFKERARERGSATKTKETPKKSEEKTGSRSPLRSPEKRSPSKAKANEAAKSTDKNFQAYMSRLVDSHSAQLRSLVDEHNSINEYIHLNKMQNNLPQSFASESMMTFSPTKLKGGDTFNQSADGLEPDSAGSRSQRNETSNQAEGQFENQSVLRKAHSIEKEKKSSLPTQEEEASPSPVRNQIQRSRSPSPIKIDKVLERKNSEGSNSFSPSKRRNVNEMMNTSITRRDVPDTTFYTAQITTLNYAITNQNSRIADLEVHRRENDELRSNYQRSEMARKVLQESILETTNELKAENGQLEKQISQVIVEKEGLIRKTAELQNFIQSLNNSLVSTRNALQEKEDLNAQNELKLAAFSDLKQQFKRLQDSAVAAENQRAIDQQNYKLSLAKFEVSLQDTRTAIEALNQEKRKILAELNQTQQELSLERSNHQATQNELLLTKKKLENAENYKEVVNSLEAQRDQLNQQLAESRSNHSQTQVLLGESIEKLAARQREFETNEKNFNREVTALNEKLVNSDARGDQLVRDVNEQKVKVSNLNSTVSGLEQLVCVKEDVNKQLEFTTKQLNQVVEDRSELRRHLETLAISQEQASNKYFEAEKVSNQQRQVIEEKEEQIEYLAATVIALREAQEVYIPTKGDPIDNAVADFVNTGTDVSRLKMLFIRETEGVYQFGSKRIYVKVEGGRILIRVGGGFLTMEEFMEQYGPLEIEKLSRTDPLKKLTKNIAVNKTLIGKCVNQFEKSKNQTYEYRSDVGNSIRILNSSPSLPRTNSKGDN